jgi:two-component system response regulator
MGMADTDAKPDVLLVGLDQALMEVCQNTLRTANLASRIAWAATPGEGRDFLSCQGAYAARNPADRPRVIFLALKIPVEEGVGFIRSVKSDERLKRTPIVVLSFVAEEDDLSECYRSGGNSFVSMPEAQDQLVELIRQIGRYWLTVNRSPG